MFTYLFDDYLLVMRYIAYYVSQHGTSDDLMALASCVADAAKEQYLDSIESGCIEF